MGVARDKTLSNLISAVGSIETSNIITDATGVQIKNSILAIVSALSTNNSLVGLTDVNINNPSNGQALLYDSISQKWINGNVGGGGGSGQSTILLDTPITTIGTYTLKDDYTNYDIISILAGNGTTETDIHTYMVGDITSAMSDGLIITNPNTGGWFNFTMNASELTIKAKTINTIYKIVGYK